MLHPSVESETDLAEAEVEAARRSRLCPSERADAITFDWSRIGFGIMLAGGAYPVVLGTIWAIVGAATLASNFVTGNSDGAEVENLATGLFILGIYAIGGALVGVAWSGFVTALTLPLIYAIAWSLDLREGIVLLGAFSGGLIGFTCVLPLTLSLRSVDFRSEPWLLVAAAALGPGLTTILGQLGGAWGGDQIARVGPYPRLASVPGNFARFQPGICGCVDSHQRPTAPAAATENPVRHPPPSMDCRVA